jgi:hypothetical protein
MFMGLLFSTWANTCRSDRKQGNARVALFGIIVYYKYNADFIRITQSTPTWLDNLHVEFLLRKVNQYSTTPAALLL